MRGRTFVAFLVAGMLPLLAQFTPPGGGITSATFASAPAHNAGCAASPVPNGCVYMFTDASSAGTCGGSGSATAICRDTGAAWAATSGTATGLGDPGSNGIVYRNGAGTSTVAVAGNFPTLNQSTTGTAGGLSGTALAGDVTNSGNTVTVAKLNGTTLSGLATGILKNTTGTGVPSIAVAGDFPTLNQSTTGNAATATALVSYPAAGIVISTGSAFGTSIAAPAGTVVGTTDTQTLTNKTLDGVTPSTMAFVDLTSSAQTQLNGKAASNASTTVAGQTCTLGSTCAIASTNLSDGTNLGLLNANQTWTGNDIFNGTTTFGLITGATQCLHVSTTGALSGTGADCGSGGGGGANAAGYYLVTQATNAPVNAINLGNGSSGVIKQTVSGGVATVTEVAAPTGAIVGTTDTQTLTNKTVDGVSPTTMAFMDATSSVQTQMNTKAIYPSGSGIAIVSGGTSWGTSIAAPTGTVVGTTDTQTLTNKTLDGVAPATMAFVDPTSSIQTQINAKAPSASPTFTGSITTPVTGSTQCLQVNSSGVISGSGASCASSGGTVTTSGSPLSGQGTFFTGSAVIGGSSNWTYSASSGHSITQGGNASDAIFIKRATDTAPTGNFVHYQNNAGTIDQYRVDVTGNLTLAGAISAGSGGTNQGAIQLSQGSTAFTVAGNSFGWAAPTTMTTSVVLESPNAVPAATQIMVFPAPTSNVSQFTWTNYTLAGMSATFSSPLSLSTNTVTCPTCAVTVATGTATINPGAVSSGTCSPAIAATATGVATTDVIMATPNVDPTVVTGYSPAAGGSLYIDAYPTANTVNFKVCNPTSGSLTPTSMTMNWRVAR